MNNRSLRATGLAIIAAFLPAPVLFAAPDFTASTISVSTAAPLEGDTVEFQVALKNKGDAGADHVQLSVQGPSMGYLLDVAGLSGAVVDHDARTINTSVSLPTGGEILFRVRALAPRGAAGDALSITVHAAHYASGAELWEHQTVTVDSRRDDRGLRIGATRISTAGIAVLGWLLASVALLAVVAWRGRARKLAAQNDRQAISPLVRGGPFGAVGALMIPLGFWMVFAGMAWRDYRSLTAWKESKGTVVGRRVTATTETTSTASETQRDTGQRQETTTTYDPEVALRYEANGTEWISTGYDTGSSLRIGGHAAREQELREWKVGTVIPCWYNPADPRDVVVHRGFGGAYLFALFPIPVFWFGWSAVRRSLALNGGRQDEVE